MLIFQASEQEMNFSLNLQTADWIKSVRLIFTKKRHEMTEGESEMKKKTKNESTPECWCNTKTWVMLGDVSNANLTD